ncbi:MAG: N-acetylglucosamine-6-phosphate deacetylase [Chlamydiales bacterium]|jgi:N-acetylglucosamine-6-phosphate deacetylase
MKLRGRLLLHGELVVGELSLVGDRIGTIERTIAEVADPSALPVIAPGLIDLHIHGFGGCDPLDDLAGMARSLARAGTTAFQPTLFPRDPERLGQDVVAVDRQAQAAAGQSGLARSMGVHLEGPFLNPRAAGAIPVADLATPSVDSLRAILGSPSGSGRGVQRMTIAPELTGSPDLVEELLRCGVRVSLGHSRTTARDARSALARGATGVTHLFNAMGPLHHREVGLAGVALTDAAAFAEIIGDLTHVGRDAIDLALTARGPAGLCLVSDALKGAGTGCDVFHWHGRDHVVQGNTAYYPAQEEGGSLQLAGSACSQLEMVRTLTAGGVVGLADALAMASATPARALGLEGEIGVLASGARADLIVLKGDQLDLAEVWVAGQRCLPD